MNTILKLKSIALLVATIAITNLGQAQETDTTNISLGETKILIIEKKEKKIEVETDSTVYESPSDSDREHKLGLTHWGGLDLGVNMLLTKSGSTTMDSSAQWLELDHARSLSWRLNLFEGKVRFVKDYVGLIYGVGFTWNSYGLKNNVSVQTEDSSATYAVTIPDSVINYTKNKFRTTYVNVPLMLEFNTSEDNDKSFHIAAGVIGGWNMGNLIRQKWQDGDEKSELTRKGEFNVNPFTLDATARIGYRNFTVFATYGLTPLFEKNKGPEVYPMTVGLQIIPW